MMKNFVKGLTVCSCLAFALFNGDCWGMERSYVKRSKSEPSLHASVGVPAKTIRQNSAPVTTREIQDAISKWSHLVPRNDETTLVNFAVTDAITHIESQKQHRQKMEALVNLICNPKVKKEYAHYVQNVYSCIGFERCTSDDPYKYGRILSAIAYDRGGGGGTRSDLYWRKYDDGFYDLCLLGDEDE